MLKGKPKGRCREVVQQVDFHFGPTRLAIRPPSCLEVTNISTPLSSHAILNTLAFNYYFVRHTHQYNMTSPTSPMDCIIQTSPLLQLPAELRIQSIHSSIYLLHPETNIY
jgi:hypothetical protein